MRTSPPGRLVALLALSQAAALIDHLALTGLLETQAFDRLLDDLLEEAATSRQAYPLGAAVLQDWLHGRLALERRLVPRYVRAILKLERALARQPGWQALLGPELERVRLLRRHYAREPRAVSAALAGVYLKATEGLRQPVPVTGALRQIGREDTADRIRALLLAGVLAAARWRREGGTPWQLLLGKRALRRALSPTGSPS